MSRIINIHPDGSDLDGDGSARHPFQSIERAVTAQQADDLIVEGYEYGNWPDSRRVGPAVMAGAALSGLVVLGLLLAVIAINSPLLFALIGGIVVIVVLGDDR